MTEKKKLGEFKFKTLSYDPNKPKNRPDYLKWMTDEETIKYLNEKKLNYWLIFYTTITLVIS